MDTQTAVAEITELPIQTIEIEIPYVKRAEGLYAAQHVALQLSREEASIVADIRTAMESQNIHGDVFRRSRMTPSLVIRSIIRSVAKSIAVRGREAAPTPADAAEGG